MTDGAGAAGSSVTPGHPVPGRGVVERPVAAPPLRDLFGEVLRRVRRQQGRTLRDVAAAAQVSMPYLSEVERGRKEASSEVLAAICRALGIRLVDLLAAAMSELARYEPLSAQHTVPADPGDVSVVVSGAHPAVSAVSAVAGARVVRPAGRYEARAAADSAVLHRSVAVHRSAVVHWGAGRPRRGPVGLRLTVRPGPGRPAHTRVRTPASGGAWHRTWSAPVGR